MGRADSARRWAAAVTRGRMLLAGVAGALAVSAVSAHDRITTKVTWDREVSRIVQARCLSCHGEGGGAPMPLVTYEQARPWAKAIRDEVLARRMPKWHAARGYGDFANDPSLSPFEIGLIAAWAEGGAPRTRDARSRSATPPRADEQVVVPAPIIPHAPPAGRTRVIDCGEQPVSGTLLGIEPRLTAGGSASIVAQMPSGGRDIVAWIRDYDPRAPTTYWLRTPLAMPEGSRLVVQADRGSCQVAVTLR